MTKPFSLTAFARFLPLLVVVSTCLVSCSTEKLQHVTAPKGVEFIDNGKSLVQGLAACGFCHGQTPLPDAPLSGGHPYRDLYGETTVPNITPDKDALDLWNTDQLLSYFRYGHNRDGAEVSQIPHRGMEWMADDDLLSIVAFLRSLPGVKTDSTHAEELTFLDRNTSGFFQGRREVTGFVPSIPKKAGLIYGQYLVENVALCGRCHDSPDSLLSSGDVLSGGQMIVNEYGEKEAPSIVGSNAEGLGSWNEEQIIAYLQTGKRPSREAADPHFCPIGFYRNAPVQDLRSIAVYLKSIVIE